MSLSIPSFNNGMPLSASRSADSSSGQEVKALEKQKSKIEQQIEQVKQDQNLDPGTKKKKLEALTAEKKALEQKIAALKQKEKSQEQEDEKTQKEDKTAAGRFDKTEDKDQWDNSYRLERGKDGVKIRFNRPIK